MFVVHYNRSTLVICFQIWHHAFQQLGADPEDHPVMLTEAPMSPLHNRQRAVEVMFERFCVPYVYVAMQAVLALYAAGRCTGTAGQRTLGTQRLGTAQTKRGPSFERGAS